MLQQTECIFTSGMQIQTNDTICPYRRRKVQTPFEIFSSAAASLKRQRHKRSRKRGRAGYLGGDGGTSARVVAKATLQRKNAHQTLH